VLFFLYLLKKSIVLVEKIYQLSLILYYGFWHLLDKLFTTLRVRMIDLAGNLSITMINCFILCLCLAQKTLIIKSNLDWILVDTST